MSHEFTPRRSDLPDEPDDFNSNAITREQMIKIREEAATNDLADKGLEIGGVESPENDIEQKVGALSEADKIALWQYAVALHDYEINNSLSKMSREARPLAADYREAWQKRKAEV